MEKRPSQAFAGIVTVSVGHCHPKVVDAVVEQSKRLQHTTTIYLNNQISEYAKELADRMPGNLKVQLYMVAFWMMYLCTYITRWCTLSTLARKPTTWR